MGMRSTLRQSTALFLVSLTIAAICSAQTTAPSKLEGRVTSIDARPVAGAKVSIYDLAPNTPDGMAPARSATTDAQGRFSLTSTAPGSTIAIQANGFGLCLFNTLLSTEQAPLAVVLQPQGSLRIQLMRDNNLPAAGVRVGVNSFQDPTGVSAALPAELRAQLSKATDALGMCTFSDFPLDARVYYEVTDDQFMRMGGSAEADGSDPQLMILDAAGMVEGRVILADTGKPVANVRVNGRIMTNVPGGRGPSIYGSVATTDADGKYRMSQMRAGTGSISVNLTPPLSSQYVAPAGATLTLAAGQQFKAPDIALVSGVAVTGKVTQEDGSAVPNASISILTRVNNTLTSSSQVSSGPDGSYTARVLPGEYEIRASLVVRDPAQQTARQLTSAGPDGRYNTLQVSADTTLDLHLRANASAPATGPAAAAAAAAAARSGRGPTAASPPTPLKGTVVDEDGKPVAGATVTIKGTNPAPTSGDVIFLEDGAVVRRGGGAPATPQTLTDADGKFEFPNVPNGAILRVRKQKMGLLQSVTIDNANRDLNLVLHRDPTGSVTLLAVTGDGDPLAGALVGIQISDSRELMPPRWATTGADGSFVLENAYPDLVYTVTVHLHGYTTASITPKVEGGKKTVGPFIRLYKTDSAITGTLVSETGDPMTNTEIRTTGGRGGARTARTNAEGRFKLDKLVAGDSLQLQVFVGGRSNRVAQLPAGTQDTVIVYTPPAPPTPATPAPARGAR